MTDHATIYRLARKAQDATGATPGDLAGAQRAFYAMWRAGRFLDAVATIVTRERLTELRRGDGIPSALTARLAAAVADATIALPLRGFEDERAAEAAVRAAVEEIADAARHVAHQLHRQRVELHPKRVFTAEEQAEREACFRRAKGRKPDYLLPSVRGADAEHGLQPGAWRAAPTASGDES